MLNVLITLIQSLNPMLGIGKDQSLSWMLLKGEETLEVQFQFLAPKSLLLI